MSRKISRQYVRTVIRVSDENNTIKRYASLGRAVGWAKAKARALNRRLWDKGARELPYRTWYFPMPASGISMVEIKSNAWDGTWHIRIIGGSSEFGNFIWIPTDGPDFPDNFKDQILVKADGFEGPYTVEIKPDLIAKRIDWKGFERTEDVFGNPLSRPITDVLTWEGPGARYINYAGASPLGTEVYSQGVEYTDTDNLPNNNSFGVGNFVVGAAIQGTFGSPEGRKDVLVLRGDHSTRGGTQAIGFLNWEVWARTEGGTEGEFHISTGPTDPIDDNPDGWKLLATIPAPDAVNVERYSRMPVWFFNQSGTEASLMLPVQAGGWSVRRTDSQRGAVPSSFPMDLTLGTLSIDAFAETATAVFDSTWEPLQTRVSFQHGGNNSGFSAVSASGTTTAFCSGCPTGEVESSATKSSRIEYGGEVRRVAVDYKGDTRVFARLTLREGAGTADDITGTKVTTSHGGAPDPGCSDSTIQGGWLLTEKFGYDVQVGSAIFPYAYTDRTIVADAGSYSNTRTDEHNLHTNGGIQWMDLRNDLIVSAESAHLITVSQAGSVSETFANGTTDTSVRVRYGPILTQDREIAGVKAVRSSATLVEHQEKVDREPVSGGFASVDFPIAKVSGDSELINLCRFFPKADWPSTVWQIITWALNPFQGGVVTPETSRTNDLNPVSLESMTSTDSAVVQNISSARSALMPSGTATDTAGNVALSIRTYSGRPYIWATGTYGGPEWLNYIDGDDMVDVMNQVTYVDPGPDDILGTADDFDLPPVDPVTGRADAPSAGRSSTIFIL